MAVHSFRGIELSWDYVNNNLEAVHSLYAVSTDLYGRYWVIYVTDMDEVIDTTNLSMRVHWEGSTSSGVENLTLINKVSGMFVGPLSPTMLKQVGRVRVFFELVDNIGRMYSRPVTLKIQQGPPTAEKDSETDMPPPICEPGEITIVIDPDLVFKTWQELNELQELNEPNEGLVFKTWQELNEHNEGR